MCPISILLRTRNEVDGILIYLEGILSEKKKDALETSLYFEKALVLILLHG